MLQPGNLEAVRLTSVLQPRNLEAVRLSSMLQPGKPTIGRTLREIGCSTSLDLYCASE